MASTSPVNMNSGVHQSPPTNRTKRLISTPVRRRRFISPDLEDIAFREKKVASHNFLMSQEVSLLFRLNVCVTNFGYFLLSYKLLFKLIDISAGDRLAFPLILESIKYNHEFHGVYILMISVLSTIFHAAQMDLFNSIKDLKNSKRNRTITCACLDCFATRSKESDMLSVIEKPIKPRRSRSEPDFLKGVENLVSHSSPMPGGGKKIVKSGPQMLERIGKATSRSPSPVSTLCLQTETLSQVQVQDFRMPLSPISPPPFYSVKPASASAVNSKSFRTNAEDDDERERKQRLLLKDCIKNNRNRNEEENKEEKFKNAMKNYPWKAVSALICCDVVTAVSYCLFLILSHGEKTMITYGVLPLCVLLYAADGKAKKDYWRYAIFHSLWHVLSAGLMAKILIAVPAKAFI